MIRTTTAFFVLRDGCLRSFLCDVWKDEYGDRRHIPMCVFNQNTCHEKNRPPHQSRFWSSQHELKSGIYSCIHRLQDEMPIGMLDYTIELEICHKDVLSTSTPHYELSDRQKRHHVFGLNGHSGIVHSDYKSSCHPALSFIVYTLCYLYSSTGVLRLQYTVRAFRTYN